LPGQPTNETLAGTSLDGLLQQEQLQERGQFMDSSFFQDGSLYWVVVVRLLIVFFFDKF
jgi:hypothetical protein